MASRYGDCCMGAECSMPIKTVTFYHHSIMCSGFLHVPCGVTDIDDRTTCLQCYQKSRPNVGDKSPRKLAAVFVEAQRRIDVVMAPTALRPSSTWPRSWRIPHWAVIPSRSRDGLVTWTFAKVYFPVSGRTCPHWCHRGTPPSSTRRVPVSPPTSSSG